MQRLIVLYCKAISDRRMAGALWLDITEMGKEDVEERLGHILDEYYSDIPKRYMCGHDESSTTCGEL
jgi:hypothetical protein